VIRGRRVSIQLKSLCQPKSVGVALLGGFILASMAAGPARAQAKLDAKYAVTLAGVKLGEGSWIIDIGDNQFSVVASGATTGLARMFGSGQGRGSSKGAIKNDQLVPARYDITIKTGRKAEDVELKLDDGTIKDVSIKPKPPKTPGIVPVTEAHKRNVLDPMTGSLLRVSGTTDLMDPQVCKQHSAIFDGRMRYDLSLTYKRREQVDVPGYRGPALVCAIYFSPLAGHVPDRATIKYLVSQRDMETWLVPIEGTRVMVPIRVQVPTPLGLGVMEATAFDVRPKGRRASLESQ